MLIRLYYSCWIIDCLGISLTFFRTTYFVCVCVCVSCVRMLLEIDYCYYSMQEMARKHTSLRWHRRKIKLNDMVLVCVCEWSGRAARTLSWRFCNHGFGIHRTLNEYVRANGMCVQSIELGGGDVWGNGIQNIMCRDHSNDNLQSDWRFLFFPFLFLFAVCNALCGNGNRQQKPI